MSYSILRVARVKNEVNTRGLQRHNQRENKNYNNKDINHEDTYKNYDLINQQNIEYNQKIMQVIQDNYTQERKIRTDAVKHVDGLITSDDAFFNSMSEEETKQFFKDSLSFLEEKYGKENMLYATVHMDEKTPHMHFGFVPITEDGRLSAKEMLGNKKAMTELQDDFNAFVNERGYNLERGIAKSVSEKEHIDMDRFKKETQFHEKELETVKQELESFEKRLDAHTRVLRDTKDLEHINYENELKKVSKGLFSSEEVPTGNKLVSASEFEQLQTTISSARAILDEYESLRDKSLEERNSELRTETLYLYRQNDRLSEENSNLKAENKDLKNFKQKVVNMYHMANKVFPNFKEGFDKLKSAAQNMADKAFSSNQIKVGNIFKDTADFMQDVEDRVNQNQSELTEDGRVKKSVVKQKQNDLEL